MATLSLVSGRVAGDVALAVGQDTGTVALDLDAVPARVFVSVESPDGSVIFASVEGDPRDDGFDFSLSAAPDAVGFNLHYLCDF